MGRVGFDFFTGAGFLPQEGAGGLESKKPAGVAGI